MSAFSIRPLAATDSAAYNAFLRTGVREHPDTLRIAEADVDAEPFRTDAGEGSVTLAAMSAQGKLIGVVTVERERGRQKRSHIAWLLRMYVHVEHAGAGVGRALLRAALESARHMPGVQKLNLTVAEHNQRAVALYTSEGFRPFSREDDAFRDPSPRTELTMSRSV